MSLLVKICGLGTAGTVDVAVKAGADMVGFNTYEGSPRYVSPEQTGALCARVPERVDRVGVFVDPDDDMLAAYLDRAPLDVIQLHGRETPARAADVRRRFGKSVMKVLGVSTAADLNPAADYRDAADRLMLDAKAPKGADRPGGNAMAFDWALLAGWQSPLPWLLAGGLRPDNVAEAVAATGAPGVDVASGVESAPGVKDPAAIEAFIAAARSAESGANGSISDDGLPKLML